MRRILDPLELMGARVMRQSEGGRLPLTTNLAHRVRSMLHDPNTWHEFPEPVREWLRLQRHFSAMPTPDGLLVETFPREGRWYLVAYTFEGRNAHQTLGMLLTRRMERMGHAPLGFVATDYVIGVWSANEPDRSTNRSVTLDRISARRARSLSPRASSS